MGRGRRVRHMARGEESDWGITGEDRDRMAAFASKSRFDRTPEDLRPTEKRRSREERQEG